VDQKILDKAEKLFHLKHEQLTELEKLVTLSQV